tara:strand:- start:390 stop:3323 length:2934 start_codon:yes stop_codon:yes gene_type:complete
MSVQLILFPQIYDGITTLTYSGIQSEFIVDGNSFTSINTLAAGQQSQDTVQGDISAGPIDVIHINPPTIPNVWYQFRYGETSSGYLPPFSAEVGGSLEMPFWYINPQTLVQNRTGNRLTQKMENLVVGQTYRIKIGNNSTTADLHACWVDILNSNQGGHSFWFLQGGQWQMTWSPYSVNPTTSPYGAFLESPENVWEFVAMETTQIITISALGFFPNQTVLPPPIVFNYISVQNVVTATSTTTAGSPTITNGQVICDTYEDETVPLTISVDDFKNVAEKVQSYSKAFKLPGTKRNNQIFENIFDVTRTAQGNTTFNPYGKTKCELKQDGLLLFEGYLRLIDIQDKEGEISYNVNLYSEVVAFADIISEGKFSDLDFTELLHDYDKDTIKGSWNVDGLTLTNPLPAGTVAGTAGTSVTDVLKYPFIDWTHQMLVANGATGTSATMGYPELTLLEQAFRPCVQVKYLIDKIFKQTAFNYTSNFFESAEFQKLFMDFNWGESPNGAAPLRQDSSYRESAGTQWLTNSWGRISLPTMISGNMTLWDNNRFISDVSNLEVSGTARIRLYNDNAITPRGCHMRLDKYDTNGTHVETLLSEDGATLAPGGSIPFMQGSFSTVLNNGEYLALVARQDSGLSNEVKVNTSSRSFLNLSYNNNPTQTDSLLTLARGEVGQWEFFKGLMNMFNLVTIPDKSDPNNIVIEPYGDIFGLSNTNIKTLDWTDKIDVSQIKLTPLIDLNRITNFRFVEDEDDYIFQVYKNSVISTITSAGHLYGSLTLDASTAASGLQTLLSGEEEISAEPFAATVCKRLMPPYMQMITPSIYSYDAESGESQGFKNSPRILYNNGIQPTAITYYIPEQNGKAGENQPDILQFSHLTDVPTVVSSPPIASDTNDFNFGACQLMFGVGNPTSNNLYSRFWEPYFGELYNPDTRIMTLKVNLTPADINTLNMFDKIFIRNRIFRINNINYKPNDLATVEFILIP